ncbi:transporter substrate-binding domain-containing protein [Escherichia coli]
MKKLVLSLSLVLAFSSATAAFCCDSAKHPHRLDQTYAPFESKNSQGELVGFDIDIGKGIMQTHQYAMYVVENPLDALIPSLKAKKMTPSCIALPVTEKRSARNSLHRQTVRCRFSFGGGKIATSADSRVAERQTGRRIQAPPRRRSVMNIGHQKALKSSRISAAAFILT